jgi:hypothetical protein
MTKKRFDMQHFFGAHHEKEIQTDVYRRCIADESLAKSDHRGRTFTSIPQLCRLNGVRHVWHDEQVAHGVIETNREKSGVRVQPLAHG